jgi:hypothetical protein
VLRVAAKTNPCCTGKLGMPGVPNCPSGLILPWNHDASSI